MVGLAASSATGCSDGGSDGERERGEPSVPRATVTSESAPTTDGSPNDLAPTDDHLASVDEYAEVFDLVEFPESPQECASWFDEWARFTLDLGRLAVADDDTARAVADHLAAAGAAVSACLDGRVVDRDDLAEQQRNLEQVTQ